MGGGQQQPQWRKEQQEGKGVCGRRTIHGREQGALDLSLEFHHALGTANFDDRRRNHRRGDNDNNGDEDFETDGCNALGLGRGVEEADDVLGGHPGVRRYPRGPGGRKLEAMPLHPRV